MHLTRNTYIWWRVNDYDYQCSNCDSTVIMNGYLIERADRDPRELGYRFSAQGSRAALYVTSADGQKVSASLIALFHEELLELSNLISQAKYNHFGSIYFVQGCLVDKFKGLVSMIDRMVWKNLT